MNSNVKWRGRVAQNSRFWHILALHFLYFCTISARNLLKYSVLTDAVQLYSFEFSFDVDRLSPLERAD